MVGWAFAGSYVLPGSISGETKYAAWKTWNAVIIQQLALGFIFSNQDIVLEKRIMVWT
jgi:hypothetical protein